MLLHPQSPPVSPIPITSIDTSSRSTTSSAVDLESRATGKVEGGSHAEPDDSSDRDDFLVTIKGREHLSPQSWSTGYRWFLTVLTGGLVFNATFASTAPSNILPAILYHFKVSEEVGILTISMFVMGYCMGPLLWGPLSEAYGRRKVFIAAFIPYTGFQVGCALSPNIGSLLVFRLLGGIFASAPLANSGAVLSDIWSAKHLGDAMSIFALMPIAGPALAPMISGYMLVSGTSWRWIFWVLTIFAGVVTLLIILCIPETNEPYILYTEAKRLRKTTGDQRWHSAMDTKDESVRQVLDRTIFKPFRLLFQEPMLAAISVYMSFVYGLIYLTFEAIPIIMEGQHGLNAGESGMVFLALAVGCLLGVALQILVFNPKYIEMLAASGPLPPEIRLTAMLGAAPLLAVSLYWLAWTSYPSISIWSPILSIALLGFCTLFIFLCCMAYIIDVYRVNAASALSINTVMRSGFGAGFPLFSVQMYTNLGVPGATSLLAGLATVFIPGPFLLVKYGERIRALSKTRTGASSKSHQSIFN